MPTLDHLVTSGTFSLDGGTWDVDNNVWLIGDDAECVVIDAPHDAGAILAAIGSRRLTAILCTHAHDDHVDAAAALADATNAPIWLHPADRELWELTYPDRAPDGDLADGQKITVAGAELEVLHTPGHSRGAVCFHLASQGWLFRGDTLRPRRDRAVVLRLRHDHRLDPGPAARPRPGHGRPHRPRRGHHHRGRTSPPRRMDRPRPLRSTQ
jgi:glyoxylase-like metal-dependent hydrolase (beta-lactamase superfamily II)